jgi:SAM-dependent methyltransferase
MTAMSNVSDAEFWDSRYRAQAALWSGEPNARLVEEIADLAPGRALDVGCGEGADAIWLAERGWHVTGADLSAVALERAQSAALHAGVAERIIWQLGDLLTCTAPATPYDLVSAHFMQLQPSARETLLRRLAAWVAPGGTLLIVGHHPSDLETTARRPRMPHVLYDAAEITALLEPGDWDVVVAAARERAAADPDGRPIFVHDTVMRAVRRSLSETPA